MKKLCKALCPVPDRINVHQGLSALLAKPGKRTGRERVVFEAVSNLISEGELGSDSFLWL